MMIFLTPHVYYGDDNAVSPDEYFGKEVNKMLDKFGREPEKKKEPIVKKEGDNDSGKEQLEKGKKKKGWWRWWPLKK
jgi:hypothetical protein